MMAFVTAPAHIAAVKLRHQQRWYKEELFARFAITGIDTNAPQQFASLQAWMQPVRH